MTTEFGGLLVPLHNKGTLDLYLKERLCAPLMSPMEGEHSSRCTYGKLANYACARDGTHLFFLLERRLVYAGQIVGNKDLGSFYLNGDASPLGRKANAHLFWDESERYAKTGKPGIFLVGGNRKSQPIVVLYSENPGLTRNEIRTEDFYLHLGRYPYLLPSKVAKDGGAWVLTPGETHIALDLLSATPEVFHPLGIEEKAVKGENPVLFDRINGIQDLQLAYDANELRSENHIEFSIISNPNLLPAELRPSVSDIICRQVPISPPKPYRIDRADICYYDTREPIREGTLPNRIIEVRRHPASRNSVEQVDRHLRWLAKITSAESVREIKAYVLAPKLGKAATRYEPDFKGQIFLVDFSANIIEL